MHKAFIPALLTLVLAGAAAKDNLAILPFTGGEGEEGETIAELFSFEPELHAVFNPVPRTSINRVIDREYRFQMGSGLTDQDTVASLGRQVGARYVVSGTITALGNQKVLIIGIHKIEDLRQIAGDIQTYTHIEGIQERIPSMARNIVAAARQDASKLPRLAVTPVELRGGTDPQAADALARVLTGHIIRNGTYTLYPRTASLEQVLAGFDNQASGDTADEHLLLWAGETTLSWCSR
ncbi:MAG: penicillin-binding protein activator LpoB [Treponema sp.]|jgi:TolB-like protein|nr:penicillin-binding protein activator LpoB [Treponema sp.]